MFPLFAAEAAAEAGGGSDGYWRLGLILAAIGILGLFARWRKARRPPPVAAKEFRERDKAPDRYREASDRALVELVEVGREINAQVDNKIRFLNRLVKDADARIEKLEALLAETGRVSPAPPPDASNSPASGAGETSTSKRFFSDLQARVVALRDEGRSVTDIAGATGLSTVEIELALNQADNAATRDDA